MPHPDTETYMDLVEAVMGALRLAPRARVVEHLRAIADDLEQLKAGDAWVGVTLWDEER